MTITDAQFLHALRGKGGARLVTLAEIEFAYESAGAMALGTIYLSDRAYRTKPTDTPANQSHHAVIASSPDFERSIDLARLGGRGRMSTGALSLDNCDGSVDFLQDVIVDGREIRFYVGEEGWDRADFRLVNVAVVAAVRAPNENDLVVEITDKNFLLDDTIIGDPITSGPNEGKPKPLLLGRIKNFDVTPYMLDDTALKYYLNNFPLASTVVMSGVRDGGIELSDDDLFFMDSGSTTANTATETITQAAHGLLVNDVFVPGGIGTCFGLTSGVQYWVIAAGLTADDFRLSLTKGGSAVNLSTTTITGSWSVDRRRYYVHHADAVIELSSPPEGRVTVDYSARDAAGFFTSAVSPHDVFLYLMQTHTVLDPAEYDSAAISALSAIEVSEGSAYGRAILDRMNVLDLLDEIALCTFSWYAWTAAGVLTVGRLALQYLDGTTSIETIAATDIDGDLSCENLSLPWGRVVVDARRNVVVQTDGLLEDVVAEDRSLWGQPFQKRATTTDPATLTYLANWWDYHKSAIDSPPIPLVVDSGQQFIADEMADLFGPWTRPYRCSVGIDKYALNPGDCVTLTHPRFGLDAGKNVRVMSVKTRFSEGLCDLVMVRKVIPDYTSASH